MHTPTPWTSFDTGNEGHAIHSESANRRVAKTIYAPMFGGISEGWQESADNAAYIVQAVNAHERLIAMLKEVQFDTTHFNGERDAYLDKIHAKVSALLAELEGGK